MPLDFYDKELRGWWIRIDNVLDGNDVLSAKECELMQRRLVEAEREIAACREAIATSRKCHNQNGSRK